MTRWRGRGGVVGLGVGLAGTLVGTLACSGLGGSSSEDAALDAADEAERARLAGDYVGAEAILKRRLAADRSDARSWRLLGDVNLSRGQRFPERWKENLGWAIDAYVEAVTQDPSGCVAWGRLAAAVVGASENDATAVPRDVLDALPRAAGWKACPGSVPLLELELHRQPTDGELAAAAGSLPADASTYERLAVAAPWMVEAIGRVDLSAVAWQPIVPETPLAPGAAFVVRQVPLVAGAVDGSEPRRFAAPEWLVVSRVDGGRVVYVDRKFPGHVAEHAVTRAPGCPGTTWTLEGADRMPKGSCAAGPQDRRASELYDPAKLRPAGPAHYHEPSIAAAEIPWEAVADKPITCTGGPVGRLFVDTPACVVAYDRAVPQTRSVPAASGRVAVSEAHAAQMVDAARAGPFVGDAIATHLADGEAGVGLPFSLYGLAQPDRTGCRGRGVFSKLRIVDGELEFSCTAGDRTFRFRALTLAQVTGP